MVYLFLLLLGGQGVPVTLDLLVVVQLDDHDATLSTTHLPKVQGVVRYLHVWDRHMRLQMHHDHWAIQDL